MNSIDWPAIFQRLRDYSEDGLPPSVNQIAGTDADPFQVLVSTLISLRTRDEVTLKSSKALFAQAPTPRDMLLLSEEQIGQLIFPAGFYKTKAKQIREISQILIADYQGKVPQNRDQLLALPGVGPKTANLVLNVAFAVDAICVDTHVHRISNRMNWVDTKTPEETEKALEKILPHEYWIDINPLLVVWGQEVCTPASPHCSLCTIKDHCARRGVLHSR